jgi:Na+-transporting NADH:ubiquinone oxidoreductase subunit NqrB
MPKKKSRSTRNETVRLIALIGAVISLIFGVLLLAGLFTLIGPLIPAAVPLNIVWGIIVIILAIIIMTSYGVINIGPKVKHDWPMLIIIGIISLVFGGDIGAILIVIAGIVALLMKM